MHDPVIVGLGKLNPQHTCEGYSSRLFVCLCMSVCLCVSVCMFLCVRVCVCVPKKPTTTAKQ